MADCAECRRDAVAVAMVLRSVRRRRIMLVATPLAAAAILLMVLLPTRRPSEDASPLRPGSPRESAATIRVWSPPDEPTSSTALRLIWAATGSGTLYRLTVTDPSGGVVWSRQTTDTIAVLPDTVSLRPGARYHWYVDALLVNGQRATTGLRDFTVAP